MKTSFAAILLAIFIVRAEAASSEAHLHDIELAADRIAHIVHEQASRAAALRFRDAPQTNTVPVTPHGPVDISQLQNAIERMQASNVNRLAEVARELQTHHAQEHSTEHPPVRGVFSLLFRQPRMYFEVVRVDRRILVDEHNQTRGVVGADVHKALYKLQSGRLHRIFAANTAIRPRDGVLGGQPHVMLAGEDAQRNIDGHRMLQAVLLALSASTFLFVVAYSIGHFLQMRHVQCKQSDAPKYTRMPQEPPVVAIIPESSDAADSLLASEEKRMETELPAVPKA